MNVEETRKIESHRSDLVRHIINVKDVLDGLYEEHLFTESMNEEILVQKTKTAQVRMLLDYVVRRGPNAFDSFYDVLVRSGDGLAADFLKPERQSQRLLEWEQRKRQPSSIGSQNHSVPYIPSAPPLPTNWPGDIQPNEVQLILCRDNNLQTMKDITREQTAYSMLSDSRGQCVIINNHDFSQAREAGRKLNDRTGTDLDCEGLNKLFTDMGFSVDIKRDMKAQSMRKYLKDVAEGKKENISNMDCLMVFILSHGAQGVVYGVDGKSVKIQELWHQFDDQRCPSMSSKPKLIFLQACQGDQGDRGVVVPLTSAQPSDSVDSEPLIQSMQTLKVSDAEGEIKDARFTHMCLVSATHPGLMSWQKEDFGTWFIQAVIYIFKKYSHCLDLLKMLTMVNALLDKAETAYGDKQGPITTFSLTKDLYFYPGLRMKNGKVEEYSPSS